MPSTAKDGQVSRIVPHLTEGAGVVTTRGDVHYVATEYGVAYLHGKTIRQRVLDLINIAHPKFRKGLIQAAKARNYIYQDQIELAWDQVNYPEELEHVTTLRDGTEIFFRPIKPWMMRPAEMRLAQRNPCRRLAQTVAFPTRTSSSWRYRLQAGLAIIVVWASGRGYCPVARCLGPGQAAGGVPRAGRMAAEGHGHVPAGHHQVAKQRGVSGSMRKCWA
jgi:hypothetical protein